MQRTLLTLVILCAILLALPSAPAAALSRPSPQLDVLEPDAIDAAVAGQMSKHGLPGVALAITQGNQITYLKGFGVAAPGRAMTPQTPMYLGSQSKSFTGLAIAQLAVQNQVRLGAHVQDYIPWFTTADPQSAAQITVNHLLHHTSGLSEAGWTTILPDDASLEESVRALSSARPTAPPGAQFQYFNMNYAVLMLIIEQASGEKYADFVQQHIFNPLAMRHAYTDPSAAGADGLAQGYSRLFGFAVPAAQPHRAYQLGAGYLMASAEDMAHYVIALNNQGVYQGRNILPANRVQLLFSPVRGYGMGWFVSTQGYNHGGANEAFHTEVNLYPQQKLGIVLLINEGAMLDHYLMAEQVRASVEAAVLGQAAPASVTQGWSMRVLGLGLLGFIMALCALHVWNFWNLRTWLQRAGRMSPARRSFDVAISFLIPAVILTVVYTLVKNFLGPRFNLTYQLALMFKTMPEVSLLLIIGALPDLVQGIIKLVWVAGKRV